jgi:high-affinity iron transporter
MLATILIGLREGLEASLVVGILIAYLTKIGRRDVLPRLWMGITAAIVVSLVVGAILQFGPSTLSTQAQEAIGGSFSIIAIGMVTWMIFWMARHSRHMTSELEHEMDAALHKSAGRAVVILGLVSVGREGIETALFIWASTNTGASPVLGLLGAVAGILIAAAIAYGIFRGIVRINLSVFFRWTGVLLVVVAAGVFAYGLGDLQEAGILGGYNTHAFSLAGVIPPTSWYGTLLAGLFSFAAEPTWLQVIAWLGYMAVVLPLFFRAQRRKPRAAATAPSAAQPVAASH